MASDTFVKGELRPGDFRIVCDRSGFNGWASETVIEWNGLRVLRRFSEQRHPQDFVRAIPDNQSVQNPRPVQPDTFITTPVRPEDL